MPAQDGVSDAARALAEADFSGVARAFADAGYAVDLPARGILWIGSPLGSPSGSPSGSPAPRAASAERMSLLLSVGVHGDETAPIEMLGLALASLAQAPQTLAVDLLVVVGNLDAIAQGRRFIDADLNRLFRTDRGELAGAAEAQRADAIMRATEDFFGAAAGSKWHLDLHTAIRPSLYPTFAVVPDVHPDGQRDALLGWLGGAGIDAVILNRKLAGTFSAYTATRFGASGCTVELGQIGKLGANDLSQFAATRSALDILLRSGNAVPAAAAAPAVFRVAQEIVKHSDAFRMAFDGATQNFTALEQGALIAEDGNIAYRVGDMTEYVVFPNPNVRIGQRAGLMVVRS